MLSTCFIKYFKELAGQIRSPRGKAGRKGRLYAHVLKFGVFLLHVDNTLIYTYHKVTIAVSLHHFVNVLIRKEAWLWDNFWKWNSQLNIKVILKYSFYSIKIFLYFGNPELYLSGLKQRKRWLSDGNHQDNYWNWKISTIKT